MKSKYCFLLCTVLCVLASFSSCKDEKEPELPPIVEDIIAEYKGDKIKVTIEGVTVSENAQINLVKVDDSHLTIKLMNIVPGVAEFSIPNATFEAVTKSAYLSKLNGKYADVISGYDVSFAGTVDEGILSAKITIADIVGKRINTKKAELLSKTYKGSMTINVSNIPTPITIDQRIYTYASANRDTSSLKLLIKNFAFEGIQLGDIAVDNIEILERGMQNETPVYGFSDMGQIITLKDVGEVSLDVKGNIVGEKISLILRVNVVEADLTVKVAFTGNIVKESTDTKAVIAVTGAAVVEGVVASGNNYTFKVWESTPAKDLLLTPTIEFPEAATLDSIIIYSDKNVKIEAANRNAAIDFSKLNAGYYVGYHITAEDVRTTSLKKLKIDRIAEINPVYDMQTWVNDAGNNQPTPNGLTNSNLAATFLPLYGINIPAPVAKGSDNAAVITTSRTISPTTPNTLVPGITAGTLFLGEFKLDIMNTLKSTLFGVPYRNKPTNFKVTYKYAPGAIFSETVKRDSLNAKGQKVEYNTTVDIPTEVDECSINAYLYEVASYSESLNGTNVNTSNKVILRAQLSDGTAKEDYATLTIPFKETGNGSYDPAKKYKLAIVCSSSKKGDLFMGANGSQLSVKHLEVIIK